MQENLVKFIKATTSQSGVYKFLNEKDEILYIGKAKNLKKRLLSYTKMNKLNNRIRRMVFLARKIELTLTNSDLEAILLEHNLIKKFKPTFNILLKDDKRFVAIAIDKNHDFGAIFRHRNVKKDGIHSFGPFASALDVNRAIDILRKCFLLRNCSDQEFKRRTKPCLEYQIKKCSAPCVGLISKEEYQKSIASAVEFLSKKSSKIQEDLALKMQKFSDLLEFEKAAMVRDQIKSLSSIQASQTINLSDIDDADFLTLVQFGGEICILASFYRAGNNYGSKAYYFKVDAAAAPSPLVGEGRGEGYRDADSEGREDAEGKGLGGDGNRGVSDEGSEVGDISELKLGDTPHPNPLPQGEREEVFANFIGQFYQDEKPPREVFINLELVDHDLLEEFLSDLAGSRVYLRLPKAGDKLKLVQNKAKTAMDLLREKIAKNLSDKKLLEEVRVAFNLDQAPKRIEVYDNSHTGFENAVSAMIVAGPDGFEKAQYRKFNLRFEEENRDDTAMMREVLRRRFKVEGSDVDAGGAPSPLVGEGWGEGYRSADSGHQEVRDLAAIDGDEEGGLKGEARGPRLRGGLQEGGAAVKAEKTPQKNLPNLVIIDGGKPQLSATREIWRELDLKIPVICMAKGENRNAGEETYFNLEGDEIQIQKASALAFYLQRLRDEAHRFAITTHRKKRGKTVSKSKLDDISGIGKSRKKLLLNHFGSVEKIKQASIEDLMMVKGINKNFARRILEEI